MRIAACLLTTLALGAVMACVAGCPTSPTARFHEAQALQVDQQFGPAIAEYDKILAKDPKSNMALFGKAFCTYKLNKYSEALALYEQFITQTESEPATYKSERFDAEFYRDKCKQALGQDVPQNPADIPPPPMGE
jgi:tetratricopeptide (TPR) repeat protein